MYNFDNDSETLSYEIFNKYDTLVIKSNTGTSKTSCVAKHMAKTKFLHPEIKILSITNRITLSDQIVQSFADEETALRNYRSTKKRIDPTFDLVVCLNSLHKFLKDDDFDYETDYYVYIDEITNF